MNAARAIVHAVTLTIGATMMVRVAVAQSDAGSKPPLEGWRIGCEMVAGTYAGYAGYFVGRAAGMRIGDALWGASNHDTQRNVLKQSLGFGVAGVATAGAVYGVGSIGGQRAKFGTTLVGTAAGFGVAVVASRLLWSPSRHSETQQDRWARRAAELVEVLLPAAGATIGFNSTRRR